MNTYNIETSYRVPSTKELISDGYYRRYVSYKATNEIIAYLTSYGCKFNTIANHYLSYNSQSLVYPTRIAISVYAYGLNNIEQFGNKLDNALYHSAVRMIRHIINKNKKDIQYDGLIIFSIDDFYHLSNIIYTSCKEDAEILANSINAKPYIAEPNSWYSKLISNP